MRKYPTESAFVIGIKSGKLVVVEVSKYSNCWGSKYPTKEEAENEIIRRLEFEKWNNKRKEP